MKMKKVIKNVMKVLAIGMLLTMTACGVRIGNSLDGSVIGTSSFLQEVNAGAKTQLVNTTDELTRDVAMQR